MNTPCQIIFVEDDVDDMLFLKEACKDLRLQDKIRFFMDGKKALNFLMNASEKQFIVISDINMPIFSGIELRDKILDHPELISKDIFFVFLTSNGSLHYLSDANAKEHQGYLIKPSSMGELKLMIRTVIMNWKASTTALSVFSK
jgi:CheY-like chemotaxis protein